MGKSIAVSQDLENIIADIAEVARILWKLVLILKDYPILS